MKKFNELEYEKEKYRRYYFILAYWLERKQNGESIASFFLSKNYRSVAIYGMKKLGELLYQELQSTDIVVKYVIDRDTDGIYVDVPVVKAGLKLEQVDAIIITAVTFFDEIKYELEKEIRCPIISLEEVIYGL